MGGGHLSVQASDRETLNQIVCSVGLNILLHRKDPQTHLPDRTLRRQTKKDPSPSHIDLETDLNKIGSYLLSHLKGSTIGVDGLNFSVRDGKRWSPAAIATGKA